MRVVLTLAAVLTMFYCGYWVAGSRLLLSGAEVALNEARDQGRLTYGGVSLRGFPSRFDVTIDAPAVTSPDGLTGWSAPFLQVMSLSYRPTHVIAVWPHDQTLRVAGEEVALTTSDMRGSATVGPTMDLPLDHSTLIVKAGSLVSAAGWSARFTEARLATRLEAGDTTRHELGLAVTDLTLVAAGGSVPPMDVQGDAAAGFSAPVDRHAGQAGILLTNLSLKRLTLTMGPSRLTAAGDLTIGATRRPEGRILLSVTGWAGFLEAMVATGLIAPEAAPTWADGMKRYAALSGDPDTLELPLVFQGGRVNLGPFPLGVAPAL
jgi:hypothetical protein